MSHKIDTSSFTTPEEFHNANLENRLPKRPQKPESRVKKSMFNSEAEYFRALAQAHDDFEKDNASYLKEKKEIQNAKNQLEEDFYQFCVNELLDDAIPDHVKSKAYAEAYDRGHSSGFSEIYSYMADISELVETAFFAGQVSTSK